MGRKEKLRAALLAQKPFLLKLYNAENKMQEISVLTQGNNEDIMCLFQILSFIKKGLIPVRRAKKIKKKIAKVHVNESHLDTLDRPTKFQKLCKFAGMYTTLLEALFEMPEKR